MAQRTRSRQRVHEHDATATARCTAKRIPPRRIEPAFATSRFRPNGSTGNDTCTASLSASATAFAVTVAVPTEFAVKRQSRRDSPAEGSITCAVDTGAAPPGPLFGVRPVDARFTSICLSPGR
jgi:hypothetical protein